MTPPKLTLRLYVLSQTSQSKSAIANLKNILDTQYKGLYSLTIIDVLKEPHLAERDKILAVPTLIKALPLPVRKIIGDLSQRDKVLIGLDLV